MLKLQAVFPCERAACVISHVLNVKRSFRKAVCGVRGFFRSFPVCLQLHFERTLQEKRFHSQTEMSAFIHGTSNLLTKRASEIDQFPKTAHPPVQYLLKNYVLLFAHL